MVRDGLDPERQRASCPAGPALTSVGGAVTWVPAPPTLWLARRGWGRSPSGGTLPMTMAWVLSCVLLQLAWRLLCWSFRVEGNLQQPLCEHCPCVCVVYQVPGARCQVPATRAGEMWVRSSPKTGVPGLLTCLVWLLVSGGLSLGPPVSQ
jgi:hypothetical protein